MPEVELLRLLPRGGTIVAFIVVVILFLRHQERIDARVDAMTKMFSENITGLTGKLVEISQERRSTKNDRRAEGLEEAVRDLRERIRDK